MHAYRVETTVTQEGDLTLTRLPFRPGEEVEVIVFARERRQPSASRYPLRGQSIRYEAPTDPVAEDDWETLD